MEHPNYQEFPKRGDTLKKQINNPNLPEHIEIDDDNPDGPSSLRVDFEELRRKKSKLEKKENFVSGYGIENVLENLEIDEKLDAFYQDVLNTTKKETHFLKDFEQAQLFYNLLLGVENFDVMAYSEVRWNISDDVLTGNVGGGFNPIKRITYISGDAPTQKEILLNLAITGYLPFGAIKLLHEITHSFQHPVSFLKELKEISLVLWDVIQEKRNKGHKRVDFKKELSEIHAYRTTYPVDDEHKKEIVNIIKNAKDSDGNPIYSDVQIDKLIYSVTAIDQLNALGFSIEEIGKIIMKSGKWDQESCVYPKIENIIAKKARGLFKYYDEPAYEEEPRDYEPDLENLVHADKIERSIDRLRAKHIVQAAFLKELEKPEHGPFPEIEAMIKKSNIAKKMIFSPHFKRHELRKTLQDLTRETQITFDKERLLTSEEEKILANIFEISKEKLLALGVFHAEESFPVRNQIKFEEHSRDLGPAIFSTENGDVLLVSIPAGADFHDLSIQKTVYQGIAGFVTRRLVVPYGFSGQPYSIVLEGFDHIESGSSLPTRKGIYTVPLSELFALYCIQNESEPTVTTEFSMQVPCMIALIETFATKKNISPFEAFSQLFKSNACLLGKTLNDLREVFGKQATEKIGDIECLYGMGVAGKEKVIEAAKYCGFYERYEFLQHEIDQGNPIGLEGIHAKIIKSIPGRDRVK